MTTVQSHHLDLYCCLIAVVRPTLSFLLSCSLSSPRPLEQCWPTAGTPRMGMQALTFIAMESCYHAAFLSVYNSIHHIPGLCQQQKQTSKQTKIKTKKPWTKISMQTGPSNKKIYYFTSQQWKILMWYNDSEALSPGFFYLSTLSTAPWLHPKTLPAVVLK